MNENKVDQTKWANVLCGGSLGIRQSGNPKLFVGESVDGRWSLCGPVMNEWLAQAVTPPAPEDSWDWRQPHDNYDHIICSDGNFMEVLIAGQIITGPISDHWEEKRSSQEANSSHSTSDGGTTLFIHCHPLQKNSQCSHRQSTDTHWQSAAAQVSSTGEVLIDSRHFIIFKWSSLPIYLLIETDLLLYSIFTIWDLLQPAGCRKAQKLRLVCASCFHW